MSDVNDPESIHMERELLLDLRIKRYRFGMLRCLRSARLVPSEGNPRLCIDVGRKDGHKTI